MKKIFFIIPIICLTLTSNIFAEESCDPSTVENCEVAPVEQPTADQPGSISPELEAAMLAAISETQTTNEDEGQGEEEETEDTSLLDILNLDLALPTPPKDAPEEKIEPAPCREVIVAAQKALGNSVDPQSFSTSTFADLNTSVEELNSMTVDQQQEIYRKVMPIEVMVDQTLEEIQRTIENYSYGFYALLMADKLQTLRVHREKLKVCIVEEKL